MIEVDSRTDHVAELQEHGFTVCRKLFDRQTVDWARELVLENSGLYKNTRPTPSSRHLAGFHRFPELEPLHGLLKDNPDIQRVLDCVLDGQEARTIGLSDITINRSQNWHVDLLRGKYSLYLDDCPIWSSGGGGVYKILLYLNDSSNLKVIDGSHLRPIPLDNDYYAEPVDGQEVSSVAVEAGDVVIMDLRCSHRGADEAAYATGRWDDDPRILVSTVLGGLEHKLTEAMERGNFFRLLDWMNRNP
jgi:hypothetical protein